jgi:hypothetical protein
MGYSVQFPPAICFDHSVRWRKRPKFVDDLARRDAKLWCTERFGPELSKEEVRQGALVTAIWRATWQGFHFLRPEHAFEFKMVWG